MKQNVVNKSGFTLIEILIVVLIIGLLASIAVPGYRKAVEKSKVADALTTMQAVAKSEHGFYLTKNTYTKDFADLDIALIDKDGNKAEDDSFETVNYTFTLQNKSIKAARANGEYTLYKMYEDNDIFCLPTEHYICQQYDWGMNRNACENGLNGAWSNLKTKCYNTPQERCADNNENGAIWTNQNGAYCGFSPANEVDAAEFQECRGTCQYSTFTGEGSRCIAGNGQCNNSYFYEDSECKVAGVSGSCANSDFYNGSTCNVNGYNYGCYGVTIHSGAKCIGNGLASCENITVEAGGKCEGSRAYTCTGEIYGEVIANAGMGGRIKSNFYEGSSCIDMVGGCTGTFHNGSTCVANVTNGCRVSFEAGSRCVGNAENSCSADYWYRMYNFQGVCEANAPGACTGDSRYFSYAGPGCCEGKYCAENTPKCKCGIDPNTNKHATSC